MCSNDIGHNGTKKGREIDCNFIKWRQDVVESFYIKADNA